MRPILFLVCSLMTGLLTAQDDIDIVVGGGSGDILLKNIQPTEDRIIVTSIDSSMSVWSGATGRVMFRTHTPMNQSLLEYLTAPQVQSQIEMSTDQRKQLSEMRKRYSAQINEISKKFPQLRDPKFPKEKRKEVQKNYSVELVKLKKTFEDEVKESLIPLQLNLIKQLRFKSSVQTFGFSHTVSSAPFVEETKITDKQKKALQKIKMEAEQEIQKRIEEIRQAAKAKMLQELKKSQRDTIKELEGDGKKVKQTRL